MPFSANVHILDVDWFARTCTPSSSITTACILFRYTNLRMLNPTNTPSALRDRSRSDTCRHIRTAATGQIAGHLRLTMTQVRISKLSSENPMDQWLRKPFKQHLSLLSLMWKTISHLVSLKIYKMQRMTMNTWRRRAIAGSVPFELLWRLWSVCEPRTRPPHFPLGAVSLTPESIDLRQWAQRSLDGSPHIGSSHSHPTAASRHQHRWRRDQDPFNPAWHRTQRIDQRMGTTQALSALKLPRGIPIRLIGKGDNLRSLEVRFNTRSHHQGSQNSDRSGLFGSRSCAKTTSRCRR